MPPTANPDWVTWALAVEAMPVAPLPPVLGVADADELALADGLFVGVVVRQNGGMHPRVGLVVGWVGWLLGVPPLGGLLPRPLPPFFPPVVGQF